MIYLSSFGRNQRSNYEKMILERGVGFWFNHFQDIWFRTIINCAQGGTFRAKRFSFVNSVMVDSVKNTAEVFLENLFIIYARMSLQCFISNWKKKPCILKTFIVIESFLTKQRSLAMKNWCRKVVSVFYLTIFKISGIVLSYTVLSS